jgi:tetratricopeptide (TPR) repeat protein
MLGLLLFAGALAPAFSLPYGDINLMAERYLYLPSVGFCWLLARYWPSARAGTAIFLVLVTAGSARTVVRNLDWREEVGFYRKTLEMSPRLAEVHILLGSAYMRRNNLPDALAETRRAAELKPRSAEAHNNLGIIHSRMNHPQEAIDEFNRSAELAFEDGHSYAAARSYTNLGAEFRRLGQLDLAIEAYGKALKILPTLVGALSNRGYALMLAGRIAEAESDFRRAIEQDPSFAPAHSNLGLLRMQRGDLEGAMAELMEALRLGARDAETYARLAVVAAARGDRMAAEGMFRKALELDPENERAKQGMARLESEKSKSK